jgi:hypothetical protein
MAEIPGLDFPFEVDADGFIVAPKGENFGLADEDDSGTEEVELPSGNSTCLEVPSLACLLWAGASKWDFAEAIWRHPQGSIKLFDVEESDIDYIYEWGLVAYAKRRPAIGLGSVCKTFHVLPSAYVGVNDKMTGFLFDAAISTTLAEEEERQMKEMEKQKKRGGSMQLPPDPQEDMR